MELYPAGLLALGIWLLVALRDGDRALLAAVVVMPLGMLAAIKVPIGGFTPPVAQLFAAGAIALALAMRVARPAPTGLQLPSAAIPLILFSLWGVFSAIVLVRLFSGELMVFSMSRGHVGARISPFFPSGLVELRPSASNISQTAYMLLSTAFFIALADLIRRRGIAPVVTALRWAAGINILLALLDAAALDAVLEIVRTASYVLHNEHTVAGVPRVIGGFSEAAPFGAYSAVIGAFFLVRGYDAQDHRDLSLGIANLLLAAVALSSTAIFGLLVLGLFVAVRRLRRLAVPMPQERAVGTVLAAVLASLVAVTLITVVIGTDQVLDILDRLIFSKGSSASGLERGALASHGLGVLWDTYGLGAGIGSVRANGWTVAIAASTGIVGLTLMVVFLVMAFTTRHRRAIPPALVPDRAGAQAAGLVSGSVALISAFNAYPDFAILIFAAIAIGSLGRQGAAAAPPRPAFLRTAQNDRDHASATV
ncbi:MAG: hypothetical protein AAFN17_10240 [Pseudomonadota bacterium]